ncbi:ATP-binding protein [Neoaquamicrobium sediminum]|uniref:histidine kinase n=1 Tax=Neoaquamicrobium sediminum TaxID=1849104 RepID=A0ABV3WRX6_9HYPH
MASGPYSFIDIAVMEEVRTRFAAGDALAILTVDLDEVIWANGPGAALLGYPDIEAVMGGSPGLGFAARRQIAATPGFPRMDRDRQVMVRLASGMTSRAVQFLVSGVMLPDGEPAVLLAVPTQTPRSIGGDEAAARVIEGFGEAGYFAALIDDAAHANATSPGFDGLGISQETLSRLVGEVARESDRLVKRLIPAGGGLIPAGIARLVDEPSLHLLVAVDEPVEEIEPDSEGGRDEIPTRASVDARHEPVEDEVAPLPSDADLPERVVEDEAAEVAHSSETATEPPPAADPITATRDDQETPAPDASDDWYFDDRQQQRPELPKGPVRFVWKTDANGAFSAVSDDFARAVGKEAANVLGRRFNDVAAVFKLDPQGEIAGLLQRRDTWSGRSVLWPVAGTDLRAPVDLAALPVYNRDREFEGFRGFGVVRMGDVTADPDALGMKLAGGGGVPPTEEKPGEESRDATDTTSTPADNDPFNGEVPALSLTEGHERRSSDKVVRLAEHRPVRTPGRQLSPGERNAFEEIRTRLRRDYDEARQAEQDHAREKATELSDDLKPEAPEATNDRKAAEAPADVANAETAVVRSNDLADDDAVALEPEDHHEVPDEFYDEPRLAELDGADDAGSDFDEDITGPYNNADERDADAAGVAANDDGASGDTAGDEGSEFATVRQDEGSAEYDEETEAYHDEPAEENISALQADDEAPIAGTQDAESDEPLDAVPAGSMLGNVAPPPAPPIAVDGFTPSAFVFSERSHETGLDAELVAGLPLPLLVHAGDELYFANREFLNLTGYASLDQIRREGGLDRLFVDKSPDAASEPDGSKLRLRTLGGEEFPVDAHLQSIRWRNGSALLLALQRAEGAQPMAAAEPLAQPTITADPTEVEDMARHVAEMRTIIDTATDGVVLIAADGTIRNISRPAEALFGFDSAAVEGKPFASLFAIESQRAARDYLAGLAENGVASVLNDGREVIGREAEGRFIPLFMTIGRLPGDSGYCAVVRDITQWKRAEEELTQARTQAERASSQKTEFLARVSHEIRTPLNAIIGFSELMIDEKFGPIGSDRYRDYLRDINRSGNHVLDLVNDLLDISKIEAGEQEMNYEAVSLNDTLGESVAVMQPQANRDRVIIRSSFASRLPEVVADLRSVRQIALNLLSNAVRYTQAGGQVIVSTSYEPSGDVVMRVRDTGIGMSLSEIDQALKPFKQINALKRGRHDGTGLGLPLTKAMVEANRARFSISSTPGEGTMVEITFPSTRVLAD